MKKSLAIFLVLTMFFSVMPTMALAADQSGETIKVEKAVEIAKGFFQIPKGYDQFESSYQQNEFSNLWSLHWGLSNGNGSLDVQVDADTGEVVGYNYYSPEIYQPKPGTLPKLSRQEGEKIAREFIKKVAPSKADQLQLQPSDEQFSSGQVYFNYTFNRLINGIEYPSNNISISVNGFTGEVNNFYTNWENKEIPSLQPKLTSADAEKIFKEKAGFELRYFRPQAENRQNKPIKLVYEVTNPNALAVNAVTGEIIRDEVYYPMYDKAGDMSPIRGAGFQGLDPIEQKETSTMEGLISKDKALEIAKQFVAISGDYKLNNATLARDWEFPDLRLWSFNWNYDTKDTYGWASAEVNAQTGKILAFDYSEGSKNPNGQEQKNMVVKDRAAAQKIVEAFLRANYPEVAGKLQLQDDNPPAVKEATQGAPGYYFRYERLVNGIPFGQNYVSAGVNSFTGKVNSFRIRFLDLAFPTTDNVIDKAQFTTDFFSKHPMKLMYMMDSERKLQLVYRLEPLNSYRFDAVTGEMLGWDGEPIKEKSTDDISDIKGHWAESYINTLNELGFLRVENGLFKPNAAITQAEVIKMLIKASNSYINDSTSGNWYDAYYQAAEQSGIIHDNEVNPTGTVTREELAKFMTRTIVPDKIATLNIYQVKKYKDAGKISPGYAGYVAITSELGLITGDGTNWNPKGIVKKGEACAAMVKYLKTDKTKKK